MKGDCEEGEMGEEAGGRVDGVETERVREEGGGDECLCMSCMDAYSAVPCRRRPHTGYTSQTA